MAPEVRKEELLRFVPPANPKVASVLILLYPGADGLTLTLTRRTDTVENHRGQISLPGGAQENDEDLAQTALREAYEEVGIDPASVELLGKLTPLYIPVSGFRVHPFVGYSPHRPTFRSDPIEVAEVIEVPLALLLDPHTERTEVWDWRGQLVPVPFFQVGPYQIWGATAMILAEFLAVTSVPPGST
jgi:8-oxo-dGTP pyrophosphatase MutT (NUDIX family)